MTAPDESAAPGAHKAGGGGKSGGHSAGDLFGKGSTFEQLFVWGVLQGVLTTLMGPAFNELQRLIFNVFPNAPLSAADAATLTARGYMSTSKGEGEAKQTGINADRFADLVKAARTTPTADVIAAAVNRGLISWDGGEGGTPSGDKALTESGLNPDYHHLIHELATQIPSVAEVMNAWLQGQIEEPEAKRRYLQAGGDPSWFQTAFNAEGTAPTPVEAADLANRGIIPWEGTGPDAVSYHQAFLEGPWRNKWEPAMRKGAQYLPPPRTVTAMLSKGSISKALATQLLVEQGLTAELAAAYVADAEHTASSKDRALTQAQTVALYEAQLISADDATNLLEATGYSADNASLILALADVRRSISAVNTAVSRVHSLFVAHKISAQDAVNALNTLQVPPTQVQQIIATWEIEAAVNVAVLTESQVTQAWKYGLMTQAEAQDALTAIGYTPLDAWRLLSVRNEGPLPNRPAAGPQQIPGAPA